jgi:metal-responsive CopG/Arc/MetJ family transcriptional regulator
MRAMRTTITLDDDVAAALERIRRERSMGLSEAINELVRAGLKAKPSRRPFRQQSRRMGLRVDVTNVADTLEWLEGPTAR